MWADDELIPLSALEHFAYCPRQCGLIHLEDVYQENVFTLRGQQAHQRVHQQAGGVTGGVRIERSLPLWCERLGLVGMSDVVEFHPDGTVLPVEYKSGTVARSRPAEVQLCAQALCLAEMLGVSVPVGALYSAQTRRRRDVVLTPTLIAETEQTVWTVRTMQRAGKLPAPANDARCPRCSLVDACVPGAVAAAARAAARRLWELPAEE